MFLSVLAAEVSCGGTGAEGAGLLTGAVEQVLFVSDVSGPMWEEVRAFEAKAESLAEQMRWGRETAEEADRMVEQQPVLVPAGGSLRDFVPDGWELTDSVALDFNEDRITDYVGVLDRREETAVVEKAEYPRILFAVAGKENGGYGLDFQDANLLRTSREGGVFGDPYLPLTTEGASFTTHSYGGSMWKWAENFTYTCVDGIWYLTASEETYLYDSYLTEQKVNDYQKGVGVRSRRGSGLEDMARYEGPEGYLDGWDLTYEIRLDPPPTLESAGLACRENLSGWPHKWPVETVTVREGLDLKKSDILFPQNTAFWGRFVNEKYVVYYFKADSGGENYLAVYDRQEKKLSVVACEDAAIDNGTICLYQDKIYYSCTAEGNAACQDDGGAAVCSKEPVGVRLYRMNLDGTQKELVVEYLLPVSAGEILEAQSPEVILHYEIGGGEIIAEVYRTDEILCSYYRMNADGSGVKLIGYCPV